MLKLFKKFTWQNWLALALILGVTIFQVWCTMTLTDYVSGIVRAITMVNAHNALAPIVAERFDGSWDALWAAWQASGQGEYTYEQFLMIKDASVGDIWYNGGMMIAFAALTMAAQSLVAVSAAYVSSNVATNIRRDLNAKITSMSIQEIRSFSVSSLVTRSTNDVQQYQFTILMALRMVFAAPVLAIWATFKIQASGAWQLSLVSGIGIIFIAIGILMFMLLVVPKFRVIQKLLDRINGITREHLTGIRVVRAYNAEVYQEEKFEKTNEALTKTSLFAGRLMGAMNPLIGLVMNGVTLAIYWVGAHLINGGTGINYADVTQYMVLSTQIIMSIMMLLFMFIMIPRAMVSAKRINEVLDTKNPILEPEVEEAVKEENRGSIEFKDVSFKYPGAEHNVVSSLNFAAKKGETLAFIGSTASGKSTVINLLARLYDASEGSVLVDGVNVKNLKNATLRKTIGFVPQKGILFSGTIRENIAFSDDSMPEERIRHAAEIACADEFIEQLPEKYDAPISQGGTNVSGGQKQRLCIARAIASKPDILVFDDSFSALDFKTDQKVRANLKKEAKDITKVIVAQRIGTIMDADHIVVLSEGKIVGYGRHKDLLHSCPVYQEIALSQLSKEELGL